MTKEERQIYNKEYRNINKEKIRLYQKQYNEDNIESQKQYKLDNKDRQKKYEKKHNNLNIEKKKEYHRNYVKNRCIVDPLFKLKKLMRENISQSLKRNNYHKNTKTQNILGCPFEEFKQYLENKFEPWMNWENQGKYNGELNYGWDIDHIIPISSAKTEEEIIRLSHYTNFQPLCSYTNRYIKKDNIYTTETRI